ncbi:hypothetical protein ACWKWU_21955 [Chitinophaga lutea]
MNIGVYLIAASLLVHLVLPAAGQYKPAPHRALLPEEVPVSGPGNYAEPGKTYVLVNDVSAERSAIFLGKNVTLDLNGYTIKYANAPYGQVQNRGFEEGLKGWDLSRAPGAKLMNTADIHVFIGDKLLSLEAGDEIRSSYVHLPVANRSYIAMCGITGRHYHDAKMKEDLRNEMKVSVFVEDEHGKEVRCETKYIDTVTTSSVERRSPRLGGGFVYAHLTGLPAGKYRVRVRADTDCLVDEIDIRPAFDVGVGVVGSVWDRGHYDHLYQSLPVAFFDYSTDAAISLVKGAGAVTIRNGVIENSAESAVSWAVQCNAPDVKLILSNVSVTTAGINAVAVDAAQASISDSRFDVKNPFLVSRHGSSFYAVNLWGDAASTVSASEFFGGQGCLVFKGKRSEVHHNRFFNRQTVTNHYSIMAMGDSSRIFDNYIEPETGSGIEIYSRKYIDIFRNKIIIQSPPPSCEYGREEYSANAVRIADYRAEPGAPNGAYGNRVYNNQIFVKARNFESPEPYVPLAWAFFYSASGGDNDIFDNDIMIEHTAPGTKALAAAFFITGGSKGFGGNFYGNRITSNVPPVWVAGKYGGASRTRVADNIIVKSPGAPADYVPVLMGFKGCGDCIAKDVVFVSNKVVNDAFAIRVAGSGHEYAVNWKLRVDVKDKSGRLLVGRKVMVKDRNSVTVAAGRTDNKGSFTCTVKQFSEQNGTKQTPAPYSIIVGSAHRFHVPVSDTTMQIVLKK